MHDKPVSSPHFLPDLNDDQQAALGQIERARRPGNFHLLTGYAGSGKTTLVQAFSRRLAERGCHTVLSAPTHKAVAVLARKMPQSEHVGFATVHSLLSLVPDFSSEAAVFKRKRNALPVTAPVVIIDECSMLSEGLMHHIRLNLKLSFILFVGDPAQLPPVNEAASQSFSIKSHSHLDKIVRQAEGNPIIEAAAEIRSQQGKGLSWSWCQSRTSPPLGVYRPSDPEAWMRKGFLSEEFQSDQDSFRYLCWTNAKVHKVNSQIRRWIYGDDPPYPFMPGERALARAPSFQRKRPTEGKSDDWDDDLEQIVATNEEVLVTDIMRSSLLHTVSVRGEIDQWDAQIPVWTMTIQKDDGRKAVVHVVDKTKPYNTALNRLKEEASITPARWHDFHLFKQRFSTFQHTYAMTIHTSQGSTFRNVFLDVKDIGCRGSANPLETQQLCYVGATRPTHALVLVGSP